MHKCIDAEGQDFEKINQNHPLNTYPKGLRKNFLVPHVLSMYYFEEQVDRQP